MPPRQAPKTIRVYFLGHEDHPKVGYIGRTSEPLARRLSKHKAERRGKVSKFFERVGWERAYIHELWAGPADDADRCSLWYREKHSGQYFRLLNDHAPRLAWDDVRIRAQKRKHAAQQRNWYMSRKDDMCFRQRRREIDQDSYRARH